MAYWAALMVMLCPDDTVMPDGGEKVMLPVLVLSARNAMAKPVLPRS